MPCIFLLILKMRAIRVMPACAQHVHGHGHHLEIRAVRVSLAAQAPIRRMWPRRGGGAARRGGGGAGRWRGSATARRRGSVAAARWQRGPPRPGRRDRVRVSSGELG